MSKQLFLLLCGLLLLAAGFAVFPLAYVREQDAQLEMDKADRRAQLSSYHTLESFYDEEVKEREDREHAADLQSSAEADKNHHYWKAAVNYAYLIGPLLGCFGLVFLVWGLFTRPRKQDE